MVKELVYLEITYFQCLLFPDKHSDKKTVRKIFFGISSNAIGSNQVVLYVVTVITSSFPPGQCLFQSEVVAYFAQNLADHRLVLFNMNWARRINLWKEKEVTNYRDNKDLTNIYLNTMRSTCWNLAACSNRRHWREANFSKRFFIKSKLSFFLSRGSKRLMIPGNH